MSTELAAGIDTARRAGSEPTGAPRMSRHTAILLIGVINPRLWVSG